MQIRPAKTEDAPRMVDIKNRANECSAAGFYTPEQIKAKTCSVDPSKYYKGINDGRTFVAEEDNQTVGFIEISDNVVIRLFVDPPHQGRGIGKALMNFVTEIIKQEYQVIRAEASLNAVTFYENLGFVKVGDSSEEINGEIVPYASMMLELI
jgi:GNAT superfamily N-acetyltransferase